METKKILFLGIIGILVLLIIKAGEPQMPASNQELQENDLCNDIAVPSASVHCDKVPTLVYPECYIQVSGDSRVEYRVYEWGAEGGNVVMDVNAGERKKLMFGTQNGRVEIIPIDFSTLPSSPAKKCTNKVITIYPSQFS